MYPFLENSTTGIAITEGPVPTGVMGASNENMLEDMEGRFFLVCFFKLFSKFNFSIYYYFFQACWIQEFYVKAAIQLWQPAMFRSIQYQTQSTIVFYF